MIVIKIEGNFLKDDSKKKPFYPKTAKHGHSARNDHTLLYGLATVVETTRLNIPEATILLNYRFASLASN